MLGDLGSLLLHLNRHVQAVRFVLIHEPDRTVHHISAVSSGLRPDLRRLSARPRCQDPGRPMGHRRRSIRNRLLRGRLCPPLRLQRQDL